MVDILGSDPKSRRKKKHTLLFKSTINPILHKMFCHLIDIHFKQFVAPRTRKQHFFVKKCGCGSKIKFCGVKYAEKFWSFQNPFFESRQIFLGE